MEELHSRGDKMAESFFANQDRELIAKLKQELADEECREALKSASGIEDETVLQNLLDNGITPDSLMAVSLIPLVSVAWADREMADSEKNAILKAAGDAGVKPESAAYSVVEQWLSSRPEDELLEAWKSYISSVKAKLDPAATMQLQTSVVDRANGVAKSTGGYLGLGKISAAEESVLEELKAAFA